MLCEDSFNRKVYDEVFEYGLKAREIAGSRTELRVLKKIIESAISRIETKKMNLSQLLHFNNSSNQRNQIIVEKFQKLIIKIDAKIAFLKTKRSNNNGDNNNMSVYESDGNVSLYVSQHERGSLSHSRSSLLKTRLDTSAKLQWQPSILSTENESKSSCIIS